jgi:hypothetical protein
VGASFAVPRICRASQKKPATSAAGGFRIQNRRGTFKVPASEALQSAAIIDSALPRVT